MTSITSTGLVKHDIFIRRWNNECSQVVCGYQGYVMVKKSWGDQPLRSTHFQ